MRGRDTITVMGREVKEAVDLTHTLHPGSELGADLREGVRARERDTLATRNSEVIWLAKEPFQGVEQGKDPREGVGGEGKGTNY